MITLINQLIDDIQTAFSSRTDSYASTLVKEQYKEMPKTTYPLVLVQEIQNNEILSRSTTEGERSTALGYQFMVLSRETDEYDSIDSVRFMLNIIDEVLTPPAYNIQRVGSPAIIPYISDNTIMTGTQRYTCVYDKETNLIYRN